MAERPVASKSRVKRKIGLAFNVEIWKDTVAEDATPEAIDAYCQAIVNFLENEFRIVICDKFGLDIGISETEISSQKE